jgi:hypothetical protein
MDKFMDLAADAMSLLEDDYVLDRVLEVRTTNSSGTSVAAKVRLQVGLMESIRLWLPARNALP